MTATGTMQHALAIATMLFVAIASGPSRAADTQVIFDISDTIECRDVTPKDFVAAHPSLKVIEAKFQVSARFIEGSEADLVDFLYMLVSPELRLKIQDYLPNTTLESTMADDRIEVTATTESSSAITEDARVAYKVLALGGSKNDTEKKTESDHYKEIVPKALVLASGTMNREHGVFFKLKPSKEASLEGTKTFTCLAIVPKNWRGDWCVISCAARAKKKSFLSSSIVPAGTEHAQVGLYLAGDREARLRAEKLCKVQEANDRVRTTAENQHSNALVDVMHAATTAEHQVGVWLHGVFGSITGADASADKAQTDIEEQEKKFDVRNEILQAQKGLSRLSG